MKMKRLALLIVFMMVIAFSVLGNQSVKAKEKNKLETYFKYADGIERKVYATQNEYGEWGVYIDYNGVPEDIVLYADVDSVDEVAYDKYGIIWVIYDNNNLECICYNPYDKEAPGLGKVSDMYYEGNCNADEFYLSSVESLVYDSEGYASSVLFKDGKSCRLLTYGEINSRVIEDFDCMIHDYRSYIPGSNPDETYAKYNYKNGDQGYAFIYRMNYPDFYDVCTSEGWKNSHSGWSTQTSVGIIRKNEDGSAEEDYNYKDLVAFDKHGIIWRTVCGRLSAEYFNPFTENDEKSSYIDITSLMKYADDYRVESYIYDKSGYVTGVNYAGGKTEDIASYETISDYIKSDHGFLMVDFNIFQPTSTDEDIVETSDNEDNNEIDERYITGDAGIYTKFKYDTITKELDFSGNGEIESWSEYISTVPKEEVKKIVIENGITEIGNSAFEGYTSITDIVIPDSVTSIEGDVFSGCTSLKKISLPDTIKKISWGTFENCISLESIVIPDSVNWIDGETFKNCSSLSSITFPQELSYLGSGAFKDCANLKEVTFPGLFRFALGDDVFEGCDNFYKLTITEDSANDYVFTSACSKLNISDLTITSEGNCSSNNSIATGNYFSSRFVDCFPKLSKLSFDYHGLADFSLSNKIFKSISGLTVYAYSDTDLYIFEESDPEYYEEGTDKFNEYVQRYMENNPGRTYEEAVKSAKNTTIYAFSEPVGKNVMGFCKENGIKYVDLSKKESSVENDSNNTIKKDKIVKKGSKYSYYGYTDNYGYTAIESFTLSKGTLKFNKKKIKSVKYAGFIKKSFNVIYINKKGQAYTLNWNGKNKKILKKNAKSLVMDSNGFVTKIKKKSGSLNVTKK